MNKIKVLDLFAGAGGLSYGFYHDSNFSLLAANDIDIDMCNTYKANHRSVEVFCKDIKDFGLTDLSCLGVNKNTIDLVIGGPPCQAYSTVGKRLLDDPRGVLYKEYFRIITELNPKAFIFENVKGLLSMDGGNLFEEIKELFQSEGYKISYQLLNAADYGVPQIRERVILVGSKLKNQFCFPEPTHQKNQKGLFDSLPKWISLEDAIGDLPDLENEFVSTQYNSDPRTDYQKELRKNSNILTLHEKPKNNEALVKIMKSLPEGGSPKDLPLELRPKSGFGNTYSRLWWKKPSTTITRNLGTPSSSRCIHPIYPRPLTSREGARIQSFPDNYNFCGSRSSVNLQIGNAVPPKLSMELSKNIKKLFEN
jgi:DNA (cytosine-5)-methyltransferase 1